MVRISSSATCQGLIIPLGLPLCVDSRNLPTGLNLSSDYDAPEEVKAAGFQICADELGSIVEGHDVKKLQIHAGVENIAAKLSTSIVDGIPTSEHLINERKHIYGINKFTETPARGFWVFVWEALQDTTLMILAICALVSLAVGITVE